MLDSIGIIGGGVVGKATARTYLGYVNDIRVYDVKRELSTHTIEEAIDTDIVFVCLPETAVDQFFLDEALILPDGTNIGNTTNYVLKSTVPIGTTKRIAEELKFMNLVHSPEFLTSRCAILDAQMPTRNIIGRPSHYMGCSILLEDLYKWRFPHTQIIEVTSNESEAIKLITNSFFAVKIAFFNEVKDLSDELGLDWQNVLNGVLSDGRICPSHTQVPGTDGLPGFGGRCLPKDLQMLIKEIDAQFYFSKEVASHSAVCRSAAYRNSYIDRKEGN